MSEREKLKKLAEGRPADWPIGINAGTILALLAELEQAEARLSYVENAEDCHACAEETQQCVYHTGRDAGFSEGRMEANCDHGQYEMWLSDQIMEKTGITGKDLQEAIFKVCESAAALRTLRQAAGAIECSECFHPLGRHTDKYGCEVDRGDRQMGEGEISVAIGPCACNGGEPEKEILAALAAEGGK